ncbi:hypothetical protein GCM10011519_19020 [Marmoricola endophyticus]|uniref:Sigma-70 family RNA polymerase sigma factor n=1 Tax=Marmoricola endophyticus TaxID=2040280 RepID=A0A917BIH2_9ACTN|nr:sigma-70 family RNA polymerase sigma factor [Marmoricola endophyticus]GGF45323.1 hypothetical protein GCM10011519_19020 [Marmoricola endophyticus]
MLERPHDGLDALRRALARVLADPSLALPTPALAGGPPVHRRAGLPGLLAHETAADPSTGTLDRPPGEPADHDLAVSSAEDEAERSRLIALVELARGGDKDAFGLLYDHYQPSVYRFLYYRLGVVQLAEDLTAETFFRALRSMNGFRWQGRDFGAWLMTIARNLTVDHYKSSRTRLEQTTEDIGTLDAATDGPEADVLASLTNEALLDAVRALPVDQQECLTMRFLQGLSLAETAEAMERSSGAIKQLQLRAVRNLAKHLPEEWR